MNYLNSQRRVSIADPPAREITPLLRPHSSETNDSSEEGTELFQRIKRHEAAASTSADAAHDSMLADRLSMRLLQVDDEDEETELRILRESLDISLHGKEGEEEEGGGGGMLQQQQGIDQRPSGADKMQQATRKAACERLCTMFGMSLLVFSVIFAAFYVGVQFIGPPNQPVGPYQLVERQVSEMNWNEMK
jgi:hypothetical protein